MISKIWSLAGWLGCFVLAVACATAVEAGARQGAPRSGGGGGGARAGAPGHASGGGARAGAPGHASGGGARVAAPGRVAHPGGTAARTSASRAYAGPHRTASGVARYGYGNGYGNGYGYGGYPYYWGSYPYWDWGWYGSWGWGWSGGWGWGYPSYAWYAPYGDTYVVEPEGSPQPSGPAVIETEVTPSKSEVLLDGEPIGFASDYTGLWDELRVAPGAHTIAFQKKGYRTLIITLNARPGATYELHDALVEGEGEDRRTISEPQPLAPPEQGAPTLAHGPAGRLRVVAEPSDAAVYLDGEYLGLAAELARIHSALAVPTGSHRLEAVRPGYVSSVRTVDVGETELAVVELVLEHER